MTPHSSATNQTAMIRRRGGAPSQEQESSSDDEDVFSALSLRTTRQQAPADAKQKDETLMSSPVSNTVETGTSTTAKHKASLPIISKTSSMKRHHGSSDSRKAKMEAVLQQLEVDTACSSNKRPFVPEKMGSFVQPGEEHLTTNIFVGNLAPSITEEQMTDLFRQFGEDIQHHCVCCVCVCCVCYVLVTARLEAHMIYIQKESMQLVLLLYIVT